MLKVNILNIDSAAEDIANSCSNALCEWLDGFIQKIGYSELSNCSLHVFYGEKYYYELWHKDVKLGSFKVNFEVINEI